MINEHPTPTVEKLAHFSGGRTFGEQGRHGSDRVPVKTVLVVDDNEAFRDMLRLVLDGHGFKVIAAENTDDALAMADLHPLDAVLTDFEMPQNSGLELCRELAKRSRGTARRLPVWLMTGCTLLSTEDAVAAGALGLFRKPFRAGEIANDIARYLSECEPAVNVA